MFKKILAYSIIAILAITLVGGTIAILVRPHDVEAYNGPAALNLNTEKQLGSQQDHEGQGSGNGGGQGQGQGGTGRGSGTQNSGIIEGRGQGQGGAGQSMESGRGMNGQGQNSQNDNTQASWETVTGTVLVADSELIIETDTGELLVGLGQAWYREEAGFVVNVGDEVRVAGYEEDGEFKAGTVENLTTGVSITLRDGSGRPMWAGQNSLNSSGRGQSAEAGSTGVYEGGGRGRGQGQGQGQMEGASSVSIPEQVDTEPLPCPICDVDPAYGGPLNEEEVTALYLALNDEYHAWAVYEKVIADFGAVRPFTSIQNAEANHIAALTRLLDAYNLAVPENPWIGEVDGYESLGEACSAGVTAEIANGSLYDTLFASTTRNDILDVYASLQRASIEQHLPAFARCAD